MGEIGLFALSPLEDVGLLNCLLINQREVQQVKIEKVSPALSPSVIVSSPIFSQPGLRAKVISTLATFSIFSSLRYLGMHIAGYLMSPLTPKIRALAAIKCDM